MSSHSHQYVPRSIAWIGGPNGFLRLLDQTLLPTATAYRDCHTVGDVWEAIRSLRVRGAPAIGVAAAYGVVVGLQRRPEDQNVSAALAEVIAYLSTSRPTAVNLFWALERMERRFRAILLRRSRNRSKSCSLLDEAARYPRGGRRDLPRHW